MYKFSNYISSVVVEMYSIHITSFSCVRLLDVKSTSGLRLRIPSRMAVVWIMTEKIAVYLLIRQSKVKDQTCQNEQIFFNCLLDFRLIKCVNFPNGPRILTRNQDEWSISQFLRPDASARVARACLGAKKYSG